MLQLPSCTSRGLVLPSLALVVLEHEVNTPNRMIERRPYLYLGFLPRSRLVVSISNTPGDQPPQLPALKFGHLFCWADADLLLRNGDISKDFMGLDVFRLSVPLSFDRMLGQGGPRGTDRRFDCVDLPREVSLAFILELSDILV